MSKVETGGPAFPRPFHETVDGNFSIAQTGMSLRDFIATHALAGMLASDHIWEHIRGMTEIAPNDKAKRLGAARTAYAYADAMIAARGGDRD